MCWPRPPLFRCKRDQAGLFNLAASPEGGAQLERGADGSAPRGPLRCQSQRAHPRRDALGAGAVLGQGHQSRLREHQRRGRGDKKTATLGSNPGTNFESARWPRSLRELSTFRPPAAKRQRSSSLTRISILIIDWQIAELFTANMSEKRQGLKRCWRPIA